MCLKRPEKLLKRLLPASALPHFPHPVVRAPLHSQSRGSWHQSSGPHTSAPNRGSTRRASHSAPWTSRLHHAPAFQAGLSLIEILIVLLITAALATLSWPRFETLLHKARRSEAHSALAEILHAQSRYRSTHRRYAGSLAELGMGVSPLQHYQLRLLDLPKTMDPGGDSGAGPDSDPDTDPAPFSKGFIAVASPLKTSTQTRDRVCAELRLTLRGRQVSHSATDDTGSPSPQCWPQ